MANAPLKKIIGFYCRLTPSYSKIGFNFRKLFWRPLKGNFAGQVWLVTGGSEGIGGSAAHSAVAGGATVICVARSIDKLRAFAQSTPHPEKVILEVADFSLQQDIHDLVARLAQRGLKIDVLVNNVGIQKKDQVITKEGVETSFATNILGHYLLTRDLLANNLIAHNGTVIEVSSGGMYNHPMVVNDLNITGPGYLGVRAYGLAKRAQMMMTTAWREKFAGTERRFYAMHPGWVNTASVNRSMPRFVAILHSVLRSHPQGADTIVWLAERRPEQKRAEAIWFDRKERPAHIYQHTPLSKDTPQDVIRTLERCLLPAARQPLSAATSAQAAPAVPASLATGAARSA